MNPPNGWSTGASRSRLPRICVARPMLVDGWTSAPDLGARDEMPVNCGFSAIKLLPGLRFCQYMDLLILLVGRPQRSRRGPR